MSMSKSESFYVCVLENSLHYDFLKNSFSAFQQRDKEIFEKQTQTPQNSFSET